MSPVMYFAKIIIPTIVATLAMTLFSYIVSAISGKSYKEPAILAELFKRLFTKLPAWVDMLVGWIGHFIAGLVFVIVFVVIWENSPIQATVLNGIWMGVIAGIIGVQIWNLTLLSHPKPQAVTKSYYAVLIAAHVVFGVFAVLSFQWVLEHC